MFREMRRSEKLLPREEIVKILDRGVWGVLSVAGDNGYPYGIAVNYVYSNGCIYIHGALQGHKKDAIVSNPKVSFTLVDYEKLLPEKYDTLYKSVSIFGKASCLTEYEEKIEPLRLLIAKYSKDFVIPGEKYIEAMISKTLVIKVEVEYMTGKEGK